MNQQSPPKPMSASGIFQRTPVQRLFRPLARFMGVESSSGIVLLACTAAALILANSPWAEWFHALWHTEVTLVIGSFRLEKDLHTVINDGLMTVFFFVVGLEIKRELVAGELRDPRKAALPVLAALGGMVVPALVYTLFQYGQEGQHGWPVPMATDIAFVVGVLALLGPRVPISLKIMLLSLAIADDIGAILVIASVFSTKLSTMALGYALAGLILTYVLNKLGVREVMVYTLIGIGVWLAMLQSGVHPTVTGVILGLMTPANPWLGQGTVIDTLAGVLSHLTNGSGEEKRYRAFNNLVMTAREAVSPLERLEAILHPWVAFIIMPLFALSNAGVHIDLGSGAMLQPIALAVAAGLLLGKPIGIVLFSFLAVKTGLGRMPTGSNWVAMIGAGCLGGIGFTMALFMAGLAFHGHAEQLDAAKIGILGGSLLSALVGSLLLLVALPRRDGHVEPHHEAE